MSYRHMRNWHKWVGIVLSLLLLVVSITGILLIQKKNFTWIQPSTQKGAAGDPDAFISLAQVCAIATSQGHPDFQSLDDIDRIDVRPGKRVAKVRSEHHQAEIQIDLVTGAVLSVDVRRSDLIEQIHDGSFFGNWFKNWVMLAVGVGVIFFVVSGLYLWLEPKARRRRRAGIAKEIS